MSIKKIGISTSNIHITKYENWVSIGHIPSRRGVFG